MKKIISIVLAVMLVTSVALVSAGAYNNADDYSKMTSGPVYNPSDSYTVDDNTPTCEEAILACGGNLKDTQAIYFQLPKEDPNQKGSDWVNKFNTDKNGVCQLCVYWWNGIAGDSDNGWSSGKGCKWVGYRATLVDAENRIYRAAVPSDGGTPVIIWGNGVNGGTDDTKEIFNYARQISDANIEGAYAGDYDTLPEGTPNEDTMDGCIQIIDYSVSTINSLTGFPAYGSNWYIYYGGGCYGEYSMESDNFVSKYDNCKNPEHLADPDKYHPLIGDVNRDKNVDIVDVFCIQRYLVKMPQPAGMTFDEAIADVDQDEYISIIDATRIQRALAGICDIETGKKIS